MPEEKTRNLAQSEKVSCYNQYGCLEELLDDKGAFSNGTEAANEVHCKKSCS